MLFATRVAVAEPVGMRSFVVHDAGAALTGAQLKDYLLLRADRVALALYLDLGKGSHCLLIGQVERVAAAHVDAARGQHEQQLLTVDLANCPADQLLHLAVCDVGLRVKDSWHFERVRCLPEAPPVIDTGIPFGVRDLPWQLDAQAERFASVVQSLRQLTDKLGQGVAQARVDRTIVQLYALVALSFNELDDLLHMCLS